MGDAASFWLLSPSAGVCTRLPETTAALAVPPVPGRSSLPALRPLAPLRVPTGRVLLPRQARCAQARPPAPRSPVRPPPLPWPRRRCSTKKGLARSVTHSALATSTSSGPSHIAGPLAPGPGPARRKRAPPSLRPSRAERCRAAGAGSRRSPGGWRPLAATLAVPPSPATAVQLVRESLALDQLCSPGGLMLQRASGEGLVAPGQPRILTFKSKVGILKNPVVRKL